VNKQQSMRRKVTMVRYKKGHRDETHTAIVEAASKLLRDHGFSETSVGAVMSAVGLTHGGFYAHFANKTAMIEAAIEAAFVESPKNFAALARLSTAKQDVGFMAEKYLADERVASIATGCPAAALVSELHRQPDEIKRAFQVGAEATAREIAKAPGLQPPENEAAWAALAMLMGALSLMRAVPDKKVRTIIRAQVIDALRALASAANTKSSEN
jgi:TetR/AcrR family transcriptional regulator, transcriptional repressor for nem operon